MIIAMTIVVFPLEKRQPIVDSLSKQSYNRLFRLSIVIITDVRIISLECSQDRKHGRVKRAVIADKKIVGRAVFYQGSAGLLRSIPDIARCVVMSEETTGHRNSHSFCHALVWFLLFLM